MTAEELRPDIVVFLHSPSGGGAQSRTITLMNGFVERGYEVDLVVVTADGSLRSKIHDRIRIVELTGWRGGHLLARLPRRLQLVLAVPILARYLRRDRARVLLSAASHLHVPLLLARRLGLGRIPVVLRINRCFTRAGSDGRRPAALFLARHLFRDSRAAIAVSNAVADDLVDAIGYPRERIETIFDPIGCEDLRTRAALPADREAPVACADEFDVACAVERYLSCLLTQNVPASGPGPSHVASVADTGTPRDPAETA